LGPQRARAVAAADERALQVRQHAGQHRPGPDGIEVARLEAGLGPVHRGEQLLAARPVEHGLVEGVDEAVGVAGAHQEMARHPHALQRHARPPADLDEEDGQRDGDAPAAVQDLVEQRVRRVGVVLGVAPEVLVAEQVLREGVHAGPGAGGQLVQPGDLRVDVEVVAGVRRDEQGSQVEPASRFRAAHQLGEPVGDVHFPAGYRRGPGSRPPSPLPCPPCSPVPTWLRPPTSPP
jgi:hypothetical protein